MGPRALATSCLRRQLHLCYNNTVERKLGIDEEGLLENDRCLRFLPCVPLGHCIRNPVGCRRRSRWPVRLPAGYSVRHLPRGATGGILQVHRPSGAKRFLKLVRKTDYILVAGLMSLVYSVVEKPCRAIPRRWPLAWRLPCTSYGSSIRAGIGLNTKRPGPRTTGPGCAGK